MVGFSFGIEPFPATKLRLQAPRCQGRSKTTPVWWSKTRPVWRSKVGAPIRKFGIRLKPGEKKPDARQLISIANAMYRSASQSYSQLLIRSLSGTSKREHEPAIRDLRRFAKEEKVGFFRMQAKEALRELVKRKAGRVPRSRF
jgi:hypothetical protein